MALKGVKFNVMTSNRQLRGRERPRACSRVEETTAGPLLWYRTVKFTATVRTGWISTPNIPPDSLLPPGNIFNRTPRKWKIKEFCHFFFNCLEVIVWAHCLCQVIIYRRVLLPRRPCWKSYTLAESLMKTLNVETLLADVEHLWFINCLAPRQRGCIRLGGVLYDLGITIKEMMVNIKGLTSTDRLEVINSNHSSLKSLCSWKWSEMDWRWVWMRDGRGDGGCSCETD